MMTLDMSEESSAYALERIRLLLQADSLPKGGKLPTERALAEMLDVSRRSVRRALEVLEAEGRVWRRQGAGTFVGPGPVESVLTAENLVAECNFMEVLEVRMRIEPQLAQLAAMRATSQDAARLAEIHARIDTSTDADALELWDGTLHRTIAECAGNRLFLAVFELVDRVRQSAAWVHIREEARSDDNLSLYSHQHAEIIDAIAKRDPVRAGDAMRRHLMALQDNLIQQTSMGFDEVAKPVVADAGSATENAAQSS